MNWNIIQPTIKPALSLLVINLALCLFFGIAGGMTIGISWIFYELFGLPIPLMPLTVAAFILISVVAWLVFGKRIDLDFKQRIVTAVAGTSPLLIISGLAILGALSFFSVPRDLGSLILGSTSVGVVAFMAAASCAACVLWPIKRSTATADSPR